MRRYCDPYLVDTTGKHHPLDRIHFEDRKIAESYLQEIIHTSPNILPVAKLDADFAPLVSLGREIENIDNLLISPTGKLTVVETKLWRNPQATREVIAQLMEYADRLWEMEYDEFQEKAKKALDPAPLKTKNIYELVSSSYPQETLGEAEFHDEVQRCLDNAEFMLMIVGDGIRENIEGMTDSLYQPQKHFKFGLVELQVYESKAMQHRLVIPQMIAHATELRRTVVRVEGGARATVSVNVEEPPERKSRRVLSEEEFFDELEDKRAVGLFRNLLSFGKEVGAFPLWRSSSVAIRLPDPNGSRQALTLFLLGLNAKVSDSYLGSNLRLLFQNDSIAKERSKRLSKIFGVSIHPKWPENLREDIPWESLRDHLNEFKAVIRETVENIRSTAAAHNSQSQRSAK